MGCVGIKISSIDLQMLAADHAPEAREKAFGKIGMHSIPTVSLGVVDPPHVKVLFEQIPVCCLVGRDYGTGNDPLMSEINALGFPQKRPCERSAVSFAQDDNHAALVAAIVETPAIDAVFTQVGGADMAAEECTVDLDRPEQSCLPGLRGHCLT
ncbi:hypothetical protein AA12717_1472 [Gluconacetobacter sacchari DSM 12717]|uniref:Uncharacterized protein n=1 Tax=Gluconacetobacter sacchari DSM 12717 TaxID=1307940 RepID=A0ABQ0P5T6_9PROT|nr:hypothetical protein AA12717_1472 [Gluconacetobacter sacchari DSM 12717]